MVFVSLFGLCWEIEEELDMTVVGERLLFNGYARLKLDMLFLHGGK
jgi:hypothetical protein